MHKLTDGYVSIFLTITAQICTVDTVEPLERPLHWSKKLVSQDRVVCGNRFDYIYIEADISLPNNCWPFKTGGLPWQWSCKIVLLYSVLNLSIQLQKKLLSEWGWGNRYVKNTRVVISVDVKVMSTVLSSCWDCSFDTCFLQVSLVHHKCHSSPLDGLPPSIYHSSGLCNQIIILASLIRLSQVYLIATHGIVSGWSRVVASLWEN